MLSPQEASLKARAAAVRALELDALLGEAHTSLGYATFLYDWDWARAEEGLRRGLELNPNYVVGHYWYALFLAAMGRFEEAFAHLREARALDPLSLVVHNHYGWVLYFARQYDEAISQFRKALELDANFSIASVFLGLTYLQKGMMPEALRELARGLTASGLHPGAVSILAAASALGGRKDDARRSLGQIQKIARERYVSPFFLALVSLGFGNQDQALDLLEQAYQERSGWLANLKVEPALDPLRSHPRFQDLLRRMALPA